MIFIVASSIEEVGERSWKILNHFDSPTLRIVSKTTTSFLTKDAYLRADCL